MTPTVTPRHLRGASLALGGMFVVASTVLVGTPTAVAAPSADTVKAIDDHYSQVSTPLGQASGEATDVAGGAEKNYTEGAIFYSEKTGPKALYGEIFKKYQALGGPAELGFPTIDESDSGDGVGRYNEFTGKDGETAAIYWNPASGAWVIRGRVLDAWKASGGIKGSFGYPKDDTVTMGDSITNNFVGPDGTQITWSKVAGLVTIPAALAGKITLPSVGSPNVSVTATAPTASVPTPTSKSVAAGSTDEKSSGFKWWWLLPLLLLALIPLLLKLFRKSEPEPVRVTTREPEVKKVVTPPPPAKKVVAPPPPPRPAAKPPVPPAPKPVVKTPPPVVKTPPPVVKTPPPPAPKPVTPPPPLPPRPIIPSPPPPRPVVQEASKLVEGVEHKVEHVAEKVERFAESPKHTTHEADDEDAGPVIRYASHTPSETAIQVTYENNAVDGKESRADKSDLTPDHRQE